MSGVLAAAQSGDVRKALEALRDELAKAMDAADANVKPQVAAQLRGVLSDIQALPAVPSVPVKGVVTIEDAKRKRADRQSGSASGAAAASGGRKRGR